MKKTRIIAGLAGAALLAFTALLRAAAWASETSVFFAGRQFHWACPSKALFGVACPSCGMTRSVLLTLGGNLEAALALNPGGPLLVLGALLLGASLLLLSLRPPGGEARFGATLRGVKLCASAYGALTLGVILARWALHVG